ncbi:MAG: metalloregulator ArsR/SmtB family transcription factor [Candidatus Bathyarchaeota archaeon]|jgi:ArsR family transcriptional regulator|nr:winged helix-turn-helix transcriptional regulator [Candidatus Bathyarchaeota archaeon A05DMB-5]MDH7557964.1 metalloregulator ArsR/SmtB family transcription factor [Candidatus Bathyarchaeota archaeon]
MHPKIKNTNKFKAKIFNALADPIRIEILECLRSGEKCVCEIIPHVKIAQPLVSRHLAILKNCGLVKHRKDGNRRFYSVTDPEVFRIIDAVDVDLVDAISKRVIEQIV